VYGVGQCYDTSISSNVAVLVRTILALIRKDKNQVFVMWLLVTKVLEVCFGIRPSFRPHF
jgi:hypothetical protein